ncbi:MAG: hypothetical protein OXI96_09710 [Acidimicrobiaceae bacterium]|nr:hypothetical protein [Acidimicrobiaceae bacterium]
MAGRYRFWLWSRGIPGTRPDRTDAGDFVGEINEVVASAVNETRSSEASSVITERSPGNPTVV